MEAKWLKKICLFKGQSLEAEKGWKYCIEGIEVWKHIIYHNLTIFPNIQQYTWRSASSFKSLSRVQASLNVENLSVNLDSNF